MDALLVYPDLCAHKICIADGLPDPYRDPRTRTGATVSPRGIESPSLYCVDIALGHLHRCLQGAWFSGSGLFLDCVRMLPRSWISSPPDGRTSVTVSRATAVGPPIRHRRRLERKSRSRRRQRPDPAHSSQNHNGVATCQSTIHNFFSKLSLLSPCSQRQPYCLLGKV